MNIELNEIESSTEKKQVPFEVEDDVADSSEGSVKTIPTPSVSNRHSVASSKMSYLYQAQLMIVGWKDIAVVLFLIGLGVLWALIYWSISLGYDRRALPPNASVKAASAWEAVLQVNGTVFCNSNNILPLNSSEYSDAALNITINLTFYEVALCFGWNHVNVFGSVALYISLLLRYTLTTIIILYKITDLHNFRGKSFMKKIITIWLISVSLYVLARIVAQGSYHIFLTLYCIAIPIVLSQKVLGYFSVGYQMSPRGWFVWVICMIVTNVLSAFPRYGGVYVNTVQVFFPLLLTGLDYFACWSVELSFTKYRYNLDGQAILMALYIWRMETTRFDCFIALFLGWKSETVPLRDVILNAIFSILGEIWTHTGIHKVCEDWLDRHLGCINLKSDFPEIRDIFSSIRAVLEWVIPAISLGVLCLLELRRDYVAVPKDDFVIQLLFFTSVRLFQHMFEIVRVYYCVEMISLVLCWLIAKMTDYEQKSILGALGWSSIMSLGVGIVSLQDVGFTGKFWSAVVDMN